MAFCAGDPICEECAVRAIGVPQRSSNAPLRRSSWSRKIGPPKSRPFGGCALETMIGIGVLLVGIGILWVCFAIGIWFFTRTGREGMRIQRMQADRWRQQAQEE
jgi:hypothetical protein